MSDFDAFMTSLPLFMLNGVFAAVAVAVLWVVIRSAVLSALRKHTAEQTEATTAN